MQKAGVFMTTHHFDASLSRRTAVAGFGITGIGIGLATVAGQAVGQEATPSLATPATASEDFFRETEQRRLLSLVDFNMDVADSLHAEDFQLINPAGGPLSKADYLGGLEAGALDYRVFEPISPIEVRVFGDGAAIRYQSRIEIAFSDGTADTGTFWHTDVYENSDGQWRMVWSQATRIM
jgi:hypothetical protein